MHSVSVADTKTHSSALRDRVEAGEQIAVTRNGKVVARLVPNVPRTAADAFRDFWEASDETDFSAPREEVTEPVRSWD